MNKHVTAQPKPAATSAPPARSNFLQRQCVCGGEVGPTGECEPCRKEREAKTPANVPSIVHEVVRSAGQPLDPATRAFMEPRFGHDFGNVRVHTNEKAAESAQTVRAHAYTVGQNVVFAENKFAPTTSIGRELLAHELAHTIQQRSTGAPPPSQDPSEIFESSANAAGRNIANGANVSGNLPISGIGLACAPVMPGDLSDQQLAEEIKRATEKLKPGEKADWWLDGLRAEAQRRKSQRENAQRERAERAAIEERERAKRDAAERDRKARAAAVAEMEAEAARSKNEPKDDEDEDEPQETSMALEAPGRKGERVVRQRVKKPPKPMPTPSEYGNALVKQVNDEVKKANDELDARLAKEREIGKTSYKDRLELVRIKLQKKSDHWYSRNEAYSRMTGDEVWAEGMKEGLFTEREKRAVYEDQNSLQQYIQHELEEDRKRARAKFESDQYRAWVAQGEQLSAPQTIIQPFLVAAAAPELIAAAYFGTQTGEMVGNMVNACRHGSKAECAAASAQVATAVALHVIAKGKPGGGPKPQSGEPLVAEDPNLTFPRGTDVTKPPAPKAPPTPTPVQTPGAWDLKGNPLADPELAKPGVPGGPDRVFVVPGAAGNDPKVYVVRGGKEEWFSGTNRSLAQQEKRGFITTQSEGNTLSVEELKGKRVLDLAAGTEGRTVRDLRELNINAEGMDIALEEGAKQTGFLHRGDIATNIPVKGQFDVAYELYGGLAYGLGKETGTAFQNAISRIRPGGTLYLAPLSENARKMLQPFVDDLVKRGGKLTTSKTGPPGDEVWRITTPAGS